MAENRMGKDVKHEVNMNKEQTLTAYSIDSELQRLLDFSCDGILITDGQGNILWANSANCRFDGVPMENYLNKNVKLLEDKRIFLPSATLQAIKTKKKVTVVQTTKTGRKGIVTVTPIFDEAGELVRVVSNVRDITELVDIESEIDGKKELWQYQTKFGINCGVLSG